MVMLTQNNLHCSPGNVKSYSAVATCNIGHLDVNVPEDLPTWYGSSEMERAMVALGIQRDKYN